MGLGWGVASSRSVGCGSTVMGEGLRASSFWGCWVGVSGWGSTGAPWPMAAVLSPQPPRGPG